MEKLLGKIFSKIKKTPSDTETYQDLYFMCKEALNQDEVLAIKYIKLLSDAIENQIVKLSNEEEIRFLFTLHKKVLLLGAPLDFESYLLYVEWEKDIDKKFYVPRRKVLSPTVAAMQDLVDDKLDLLTISMPPGTGKAQPLWSKVLTPNGFVSMGDLKVGDDIITNKGARAKITHIFPQGVKDYYKISFNDGTVTWCTEEHLWTVQTRDDRNKKRHGKNGKYRTITTKEMMNNLLVENGSRKNYSIDYIKPVEFTKQDLPLHPYVLGVLLGDGCISNGNLSITNQDKEVINKVRRLLPDSDTLYKQNDLLYRIKRKVEKRNEKGHLLSTETKRILTEIGLYGCKSNSKFIPMIYIRSSIGDRVDLLQGLMDTDGSVSKNCCEYTTVSKDLANCVVDLVRSLGGYATCKEFKSHYLKNGERVYCKNKFRVNIQFGKDSINPFSLTRKAKLYNPKRDKLKKFVTSIVYEGKEPCQCIRIDSPEHLYVTDDYIITHNSTLGIFFLSWVMGKFPDGQNLASAHSGVLTRSFYDGVYQIITDPEYLWRDVFPGLNIAATNSKEETIDLKKRHRFSTLTCRAINASLTGATRCDKILYADDLCSGIEEAMSKDRLDKLWTAYTNDLKSRKKEGAKEIHIATRWSVHDVIGRLELQYGNDPRAKFIVIPAIDQNGESNFDYDYGVGFSKEYFDDMSVNLDDASFRALYMNEPIEREGLLYHSDELRRFFELPLGEPDAVIGICDTKDKGTDYAFLPVVHVYGNDYYVTDCVCDNNLPNVVDARLVDILLRNSVQMCRFESNAAGGRIAEKIQNEIKEKGGITRITTKFTSSNKETKIIVNSAWVKEHCLFKDESLYKKNSDYGKMVNMLTSYTVAGKNKNDDVPDGFAMLSEFAQSLSGTKVEVFKRPW